MGDEGLQLWDLVSVAIDSDVMVETETYARDYHAIWVQIFYSYAIYQIYNLKRLEFPLCENCFLITASIAE